MAGKFVLKHSHNGEFMFNLHAGNGQAILTSQMYKTHESAINGIESVKKNSAIAAHFEKHTAKDGSPYFVLKAANGLEIGRSEMYSSSSAMENGIESVMHNAPGAALEDATKK
ncbi:MAG: YegP family protein [Thermaceae bacterium]|nr:YegP family protein [Thermaceae bacterium]